MDYVSERVGNVGKGENVSTSNFFSNKTFINFTDAVPNILGKRCNEKQK